MKLLAINFSPRKKGHTYKYICRLIDELQPASVEIIHFPALNIKYCTGCLKCESVGKCIIRDDWRLIANKMENADALIFGSPIYAWQLAAPIHVFTNRCRMYISYVEGMGFRRLSYEEAKKKYYKKNPGADHPPPFKIRMNRSRDCYIVITQGLSDPKKFLGALKIFANFLEKLLLMKIKKQYIIASSGAPHGGKIFEIRNNKLIKSNGITA